MANHLIQAKYIVANPAHREKGVLKDAGIYVYDQLIKEVGKFDELKLKYPDATVLGSDHHIALPGFINAHNHGQGVTTFMRGTMDDRLEIWDHYWPAKMIRSEEEAYNDTLVAVARELRSGITSSMRHDGPAGKLDFFCKEVEAIMRGYTDAGIRFRFALSITDQFRLVYDHDEKFISLLPAEMAELARKAAEPKECITTEEFLAYFEKLVKKYNGNARINLAMGVIGSQWLSDKLLLLCVEKARALGIPMHGPLLETYYQKLYSFREFGHSGGEHFHRLGVLGPDYSSAHGVWLTEEDLEYYAKIGASVTHCPSSNLRLYSGVAPVTLMLDKGVNVALSVDSEGINDDEDMFQEMRLAMLLSRRPPMNARSLDEWDVLAMATTNGARPLMMENRIGRLEAGMEADIILINLNRIMCPYMNPSIDPIIALVNRGRPDDVDYVMVAGELVYKEGKCLKFDLQEVESKLTTIMIESYKSDRWTTDKFPVELIPYIREYFKGWKAPDLDPVYIMNSKC